MQKVLNEPWWKGKRGEWYVVAQVALILLVLLGPPDWPGLAIPQNPYWKLVSAVGGIVALFGALLLIAGAIKLRKNLTPIPYPKDQATLIETGPYRFVRHPMYFGAILIAFGWALWVRGLLTLGYAAIVVIFLDIKSRREEKWLVEKFPGYPDYQRHVRKLIPFIY